MLHKGERKLRFHSDPQRAGNRQLATCPKPEGGGVATEREADGPVLGHKSSHQGPGRSHFLPDPPGTR